VLNNTIQLEDGRALGFALYGPKTGEPVLYFHGTPSSRLEPLLLGPYGIDLPKLLHRYNIKLIAIDRPGNGLSTIHTSGTFLSFANDAMHVLTHLNISSARVMGWSGAGPFALALTSKFPKQIKSAYIIAGFTASFSNPNVFRNMHANKYYFGTARKLPGIVRIALTFLSRKEVRKPLPRILSGLPPVDHTLMKDPTHFENLVTVTLKQACFKSSKGPTLEARMYFNDPGFDLAVITQPIHYWWGSEDKNVTKIHLQTLKETAPNSVIHYKKGEGHLSIYVKYFEEVLRTIASTETNG
jgi:pimeloyl-ACP methyl ester carboxylesterase